MARTAALAASMFGLASASSPPWPPTRPRIEYTEGSALGVDVSLPRFGWALDYPDLAVTTRGETQAAYQIVVTAQGAATASWDSGKVESNRTQQVALPPSVSLQPDTSFDWRVRWWPSSAPDTPSPWLHSTFSTGVGSGTDVGEGWKGAQWIVPSNVRGHGKGNQLRKRFTLPPGGKVHCATLYVAALGYYQAEVNGRRASTKLIGDFTNFEKRVWYDTHNVTAQLQSAGTAASAQHAIGITVAPGWDSRHGTGKTGIEVLARLSVSLEGGTHVDVVSDESWLGGNGPLVKADIYGGEAYNASRTTPGWSTGSFVPPATDPEGAGSSSWVNVSLGLPPHNMSNPKHRWPSTIIASHVDLPQIEVTGSAAALDFWPVQGVPNSWVFDFGVNRAGVTTLSIPGPVAQKLGSGAVWVQQAAEALMCAKPCGINHFPAQGADEKTTFISDVRFNSVGGNDTATIDFTPQFAQYGFRYMQLNYSGTVAWAPDNATLRMRFINTAATPSASFSSSNALINEIQAATVTSAASNFMSIPTDCPQRAERLGWMGDAYTSGETQLHNFDLAGAYETFLTQIEDNQVNGSVPDCVPFYGGHCHLPSSPSWGTAYPSLANWVLEYYDDHVLVAKHYNKVQAYVDSLTVRAQVADKLNHTLLDSGGWGDWCAPTGSLNKSGCGGHGTCGGSWEYISALRTMISWARVKGVAADIAKYSALEAKVSAAFTVAYYQEGGFTCSSTKTQTANALGLMVAPTATDALGALVADIQAKADHLDTGIVGTKYLFETLARGGRADVALAVMSNPTYPGFGYWIGQGATSLWETWEGARYHPHSSWNHVMFGSTTEFFFRHLAGIQQLPGTRGYSSLVFHPSVLLSSTSGLGVCANLSWVNATMVRPHGNITANWACHASHDGIAYEIITPVGVPQSRVHVPVAHKGAKKVVVKEGTAESRVIFDGKGLVGKAVPGIVGAALAPDGLSVVVTIGSGRYLFSSAPSSSTEMGEAPSPPAQAA